MNISARIIVFAGVILATAFIIATVFFWSRLEKKDTRTGSGLSSVSHGMLSLIIEPDDGMESVLAAIRGAKISLDLVMYELDDPRIEAELIAVHDRGVAVRVLLSTGYEGAPSTVNARAFGALRSGGIAAQWTSSRFSLTHEKSLVVDGRTAIIMTFNMVAKYYPTGRDFGIVDRDGRDVGAIEKTFDEDWGGGNGASAGNGSGESNSAAAGDDLVWSPGSRPDIVSLITGARYSLVVYNEEMADANVVSALIDAAQRGVSVDIVMTNSSEWKWEFAELATAGAHIHTFADDPDAPLYIHAKMIVADGVRAFAGSENFSATSLDENRELGIMIADPVIISSFTRVFAEDWRNATPFVMP